jgi:hypothetical protein
MCGGETPCSCFAFCQKSLAPRMLFLQMAQAPNILGAQLTEFGTPGTNCGRRDAVISGDFVDRVRSRFAQDFRYLPLRKIHSLHSEFFRPASPPHSWAILTRHCARAMSLIHQGAARTSGTSLTFLSCGGHVSWVRVERTAS